MFARIRTSNYMYFLSLSRLVCGSRLVSHFHTFKIYYCIADVKRVNFGIVYFFIVSKKRKGQDKTQRDRIHKHFVKSLSKLKLKKNIERSLLHQSDVAKRRVGGHGGLPLPLIFASQFISLGDSTILCPFKLLKGVRPPLPIFWHSYVLGLKCSSSKLISSNNVNILLQTLLCSCIVFGFFHTTWFFVQI